MNYGVYEYRRLYPNDVGPCPFEKMMPNHSSFGTLSLMLLGSQFPWVDGQLRKGTRAFAF